jgi:hypothetical protein
MVGQKRGRDAGDDLLDDGALPKKKVGVTHAWFVA